MANLSTHRATPLRIGISSCLLGNKVRFDGGHKHDTYITGTLGQFFELVPVCPEVGIGLGVPREPIRLEGDTGQLRAIGIRNRSLDVTEALSAYGRHMAQQLNDISGYIFKNRSPSCGMERVNVYKEGHSPSKQGVGLYARALMETLPLLPVEEEGRLSDPGIRENFVERIFAYRRWQELVASGLTPAKLVAFHTAHKLSVMSHGPQYLRALGRLVAEAGSKDHAATFQAYIARFMEALKHQATRTRHTNVLIHLMGYLKKHLSTEDKAEILDLITAYRLGQLPLIVPITLLKHHFRRFPWSDIDQQVYLNPYPPELMLRNSL